MIRKIGLKRYKQLTAKRKPQKTKLAALVREVALLRDGNACLRCGKRDTLQASHIYPKGKYRRMEFDIDNVKILCWRCHFEFWHKNPIEAWEWLQSVVPPERLQRLKLMTLQVGGSPMNLVMIKLLLEQDRAKYTK